MSSGALRNPYLDVFLKYMEADPYRYGWSPKTDWCYTDGFAGPRWDRHLADTLNAIMAKTHLRERMAFAVPNDEAIMAIAQLEQPVVEIGAGTGYWAWLLEQAGVDVAAYDIAPGKNDWCEGELWTTVRKAGPVAMLKHQDRALMLCWPPYNQAMASNCLTRYRGDTLIYIGEGDGGCTADAQFFRVLEDGWTQEREVAIPQWEGLHDFLTIYRRT